MKAILLYTSLIFISLYSCKHTNEPAFKIYYNYNEAYEKAKESGHNIFLAFDFHGNPTRSTTKLLGKKNVQKLLKEYVVIHLFLDGDDLNSTQYSKLQIEKYKTKYQPCYYILNSRAEILKGPLGYSNKKDIKSFIPTSE